MNKISIAIADDNEPFRKAITKVIHSQEDFQIVVAAENGRDLLRQLKQVTPDIILMDIRMPEMDGIQTSLKCIQMYPWMKVIALSQYDMETNIVEMNICGVKSFIGKDDRPEELFKAIRIVHSGGVYMTDKSAEIIQRYLCKAVAPMKNRPSVTEQEKALIKDIAKGLSSVQIGKKISKSHRTIEDMREKLYHKFGVANKEQFIMQIAKMNLDEL